MVERYTNLRKIPDKTASKKNNLSPGNSQDSPAPNPKKSAQESEIPSFYTPATEKKKKIGYMGFMSSEQQKRDQATLEERNKKNQETRKLTQTSPGSKNGNKPSESNGKGQGKYTRIRPIAEQNESSADSHDESPENTQKKISSRDNKNEISFDTDSNNGQITHNPNYWNDEISALEQYIKNVDYGIATDSQESQDYTDPDLDQGQLPPDPANGRRPSHGEGDSNLFRAGDSNLDDQNFKAPSPGTNGSSGSKKYEGSSDGDRSGARGTGRGSVDSPSQAAGSNGVKESGRDG